MNGAGHAASVRVAGGLGAPRQAREKVLAALRHHIPASRLDDVALLVSELVTNSVRHAGAGPESEILVDVRLLEDRLRLSVADSGSASRPHVATRRVDQPGGLGLLLVDRLAAAWGVADAEVGGTTVWCELALAPH